MHIALYGNMDHYKGYVKEKTYKLKQLQGGGKAIEKIDVESKTKHIIEKHKVLVSVAEEKLEYLSTETTNPKYPIACEKTDNFVNFRSSNESLTQVTNSVARLDDLCGIRLGCHVDKRVKEGILIKMLKEHKLAVDTRTKDELHSKRETGDRFRMRSLNTINTLIEEQISAELKRGHMAHGIGISSNMLGYKTGAGCQKLDASIELVADEKVEGGGRQTCSEPSQTKMTRQCLRLGGTSDKPGAEDANRPEGFDGKIADSIMKKMDIEITQLQRQEIIHAIRKDLEYYGDQNILKPLEVQDEIPELCQSKDFAELLMMGYLVYTCPFETCLTLKKGFHKLQMVVRTKMTELYDEIENDFLREQKELDKFKEMTLKQYVQIYDKFLAWSVLEGDGIMSSKRRVPNMFTCGHVDVETEGGVIPVKKWDEKYFHQKFDYEHKLPRTNINISTLHGIEGGFYFKCVLYDCLHYNKCYLIAWLELCFIVGVGQQMVHVEIPLSTEKALSPHALCLLLRFVKHGPCIALRESVQYTFGRKKFLYYHSSNSLHLVLNSSCYVTLVEQTYVQQGSGEVEFSMHFHSNELVSNLAQDQQVDNLVDENQAQRNGQSSDETDPKSSNRKRAIIYRNQNSDRKMLTTVDIIETYSCKIPTLVVQETVDIDRFVNLDFLELYNIIYTGEILEAVKRTSDEYAFIPSRALRYNEQPPGSLIRQVVRETTQVIPEVSSVIKLLAMEYYEEMLDSFVQSFQVQTMSERTDSALDALLSAFLVVLLSRLAQLRRELAEEELLALESESTDCVKHFKYLDTSISLERDLGLRTKKKKQFSGWLEGHKKKFQFLSQQERGSNIPLIYHKIKIVIDRLNQIKEFYRNKMCTYVINRNNTISGLYPKTREA